MAPMKFLHALEAVLSGATRTLWLNLILAAAALFAMSAICSGAGLGYAALVLTWCAVLPLCLGAFFFTDTVREEMKARA